MPDRTVGHRSVAILPLLVGLSLCLAGAAPRPAPRNTIRSLRFRVLSTDPLSDLLPSGRGIARAPSRHHCRRHLAQPPAAARCHAATADARRPRRSDGSLERIGDAGPLQHDRRHGGVAGRQRVHRQRRRLAAHWSSRTSSRTSCTSIARSDGRGCCAVSSAGRRSRFPISFCRQWQIEGLATYRRERDQRRRTAARRRLLRDCRRGGAVASASNRSTASPAV